MDLLTLILGAVVLLLILYKLGTSNHDHFTSRGIKCLPTIPFFGSTANMIFKTRHMAYVLLDLCTQYKDQSIVGLIQFSKPVLVVKDPELIKKVMVKDFDHFTDHRDLGMDEIDTLSKNLFTMKGEKWRIIRNTLSPAFSSKKLKNMFPLIHRCGQQLVDYLQEQVDKQSPGEPYVLEMKDLFTRFTTDVIATTAFGIHIDSLKEKDNEFYLTGKGLTSPSFQKVCAFIAGQVMPKVAAFFNIGFLTNKERNFFLDLIHDAITTREKHGIVRPDMIHMLMQARKGELKAEQEDGHSIAKETINTKKADLTEHDIAAQSIIFFFAGFETASTLISFTSILLATNEDCQRKLQQEIDKELSDGGELTYEKVQNMKYLDMVISGSLRIFPPVPFLDRQCTKTYTFPSNENQPAFTIRKGEGIFFPAYAIHHDPDNYPDPEKFDPERFSDEKKQNIKPYTYIPFGGGPRLCIGQRLALLEAKIAIVHIMSQFDLVVVDKTPLPLTLNPDSFTMKVNGDFWMGAAPRKKATT